MTPTNRESQPDADDRPQPVQAQGLTMAYGRRIIQHDLTFTIRRGETFVIMGGSGCGKSTLLQHPTHDTTWKKDRQQQKRTSP